MRRPNHNSLQLFRRVIIHTLPHRKPRQQRRRQQTAPRRRTDQCEPRQVQPDASGIRALINNNIQFEILHRWIKIFLDRFLQTMNLVNEQEISFLKIRQQPCKIARLLNRRP